MVTGTDRQSWWQQITVAQAIRWSELYLTHVGMFIEWISFTYYINFEFFWVRLSISTKFLALPKVLNLLQTSDFDNDHLMINILLNLISDHIEWWMQSLGEEKGSHFVFNILQYQISFYIRLNFTFLRTLVHFQVCNIRGRYCSFRSL